MRRRNAGDSISPKKLTAGRSDDGHSLMLMEVGCFSCSEVMCCHLAEAFPEEAAELRRRLAGDLPADFADG